MAYVGISLQQILDVVTTTGPGQILHVVPRQCQSQGDKFTTVETVYKVTGYKVNPDLR